MDRNTVIARLASVGLAHWSCERPTLDGVNLNPYGAVTYDELVKVSQAFNTTRINVSTERGYYDDVDTVVEVLGIS